MTTYTKEATAASMARYEDILKGKYPASQHVKRVAEYFKSRVPDATGVLYLQGRQTKLLEDNDEAEPFRQRRYFFYLTGCPLADCHYTYDLATGKSTLYIPPVDPESVIWSGLPTSREEALKLWDVDECRYTHDVSGALAEAAASLGDRFTFFALDGQVPADIDGAVAGLAGGAGQKNLSVLKEAIESCRVIKSEYELALIRKANDISSAAHRSVLGMVRHATNETEIEAQFLCKTVGAGSKNQSYHPICASGRAASTLHYPKNNAPMPAGKLNVLLDAGCEWDCYASDITRTFPISGHFSKESRAIYDIVYRMHTECTKMLRAGVNWDDVHLLAHTIAVEGLLELGIFKGDRDEIVKARTSVAFFPHGLGHYLGMDTHDVGGNPNYNDSDPMFRYLRTRGKVPAGSVVTVEPGVYFCEFIIEPYLQDPKHSGFIDEVVLEKYWDVGGVRIEDNIIITEDGSVNLTTAPKDAEELEKIISSS